MNSERSSSGNQSCVRVQLGDRSYDIQISSGEVGRFIDLILEAIPDLSHALLISDEAVESPWADQLKAAFEQKAVTVRVSDTSVRSGEGSKSIEEFSQWDIW